MLLLSFLVGAFSPLILKIIIDTYVFIAILNFVFWLVLFPHCSFLFLCSLIISFYFMLLLSFWFLWTYCMFLVCGCPFSSIFVPSFICLHWSNSHIGLDTLKKRICIFLLSFPTFYDFGVLFYIFIFPLWYSLCLSSLSQIGLFFLFLWYLLLFPSFISYFTWVSLLLGAHT